MAKSMDLKINNSLDASVKTGKWKDPGASLYDQLLQCYHYEGGIPADGNELDELIKKDGYKTWMHFLKEAYLVAPVSKINNSPHGVTPYSRSGCKYPHHVIHNGELVVHQGGLKAAYSRAKQMGIFSGEVKEHLERHYKELGLYDHSTMKIAESMEQNFSTIEAYIFENTGIDLYTTDQLFEERSHGLLKSSFRIVKDTETGHNVKLVFDLNKEDIKGINDNPLPGEYGKKRQTETINRVKCDGHNNFKSTGTLKAIIDLTSGKKMNKVIASGPLYGRNQPIEYYIGMKEDIPTFKSTSGKTHDDDGYYSPNKENHQVNIDGARGKTKSKEHGGWIIKARHLDTPGTVSKNRYRNYEKEDDDWNENFDLSNILNIDLFEEKSHGKLKSSFRKGLNIENGHIIKVVFDLDSIQINPDQITDPTKRQKLLHYVKKNGHNNFVGKGTVTAIIDEDSSQRLQSVKMIGIWSDNIFTIPKNIRREYDYNADRLSTYPLDVREKIVHDQKFNIKDSDGIMSISVGKEIDRPAFMATSNVKSLKAFADLIDYGTKMRQRGTPVKEYLKKKDLEYTDSILESEIFEEKSHGNLKYSFRNGINPDNGHIMKIVFNLNPDDISHTGHTFASGASNENHDRDSFKNIRKTGNNNFASKGKVVSIVDTDTNQKLNSCRLIGGLSSYLSDVGPIIKADPSIWHKMDNHKMVTSFNLNDKFVRELLVKCKSWNPPANIIQTFTVGQVEDGVTYKATKFSKSISTMINNMNTDNRIKNYNGRGVNKTNDDIIRKINAIARDIKNINNSLRKSSITKEEYIKFSNLAKKYLDIRTRAKEEERPQYIISYLGDCEDIQRTIHSYISSLPLTYKKMNESVDPYQEATNCIADIEEFMIDQSENSESANNNIYPLKRSDVTSPYFVKWLFKTDEFRDDAPENFNFDMLINNPNKGIYAYGYYLNNLEGIIKIKKNKTFYSISMLFVNESSEGRGIGQALLKFAINKFGDSVLRLNVFTFNTRAIHIYKKYGFRVVDTVEVKEEPGESSRFVGKKMYIMERDIAHHVRNGIYPLLKDDINNGYLTDWIFSDKELSDIDRNNIDTNQLVYDEKSGNFSYGYFIAGKPEAMIRITKTDGDKFYGISMFYVNKEFRGHGIGTMLFNFAISKYGNNDLILNVSLDNENKDLVISFYKKYGFKITYKNETPEKGSPYVVMERISKDSKEGLKVENVGSDDLSWVESYLMEDGENAPPVNKGETPPKPTEPSNTAQPEKPEKKESMPQKAAKAESSANGVRRKKLYIAFIEWAKSINPKNTFGSIFDKDAFNTIYPFIDHEMRYFYRLANPLLCVLTGDLTFFAAAELKKLNMKNSRLSEMMIFAATKEDVRVFNKKDKKVYRGVEENGMLKLAEVLGETFDTYLQKMINQGDILNGPIEESVEILPPMNQEGRVEL